MRRLLLITYYFPPSGGPGVQRSLKFAKYLPEFGWEVTVLTVDPEDAAYPDLDPGLEHEIPVATRTIRTPAWDPYAAYARLMGMKKDAAVGIGFVSRRRPGLREKTARWIRANLFLPDARVGWVPYGKRAARRELKGGGYDAVFSTGPPHSTHFIALAMKRQFGVPWMLDLRDAWPPDSYAHLLPTTHLVRWLDGRKRNRTYAAADHLLTVSTGLGSDLERTTDTPIAIIPNGFDEDDFLHIDPIADASFTIVYTGNLTAEQNPVALWHVLKNQLEKGEWDRLRIRLVGNIAVEILSSIEESGIERIVDVIPYVEHREAIRHMVGASLLLLCINRVPNPDGIVTGKLYEYLASARPILCFAPTHGVAVRIIASAKAGAWVGYEDREAVLKTIDRYYAAWKEGENIGGARREDITAYSRRAQSQHLGQLLDRMVAKEPDREDAGIEETP